MWVLLPREPLEPIYFLFYKNELRKINIYQKIDHKLDKLENKIEKQVKKELIHTRLEEQFRGKDWAEKIKAIIKIISA